MIKNKKIYMILFSLAAFSIILTSNVVSSRTKKCEIIVLNTYKQHVKLQVEIADTEDKQQSGLMYRKKMDRNCGMLFIFRTEKYRNFWMKNTYLPLSIAYINKYGIISEIYEMKPLDSSITYPSTYPSTYALEVNIDWFKENNIKRGCRILFNGCIGKQDSSFH
jgi:uncharacterized membrane protein (UPF0127 family)